jgi:hypothetical protein
VHRLLRASIVLALSISAHASAAQADEVCSPIIPDTTDAVVNPPSDEVPPEIAAYSGAWQGRWDGERATRLVVEEVGLTTSRLALSAEAHRDNQGVNAAVFARFPAPISADGIAFQGRFAFYRFVLNEDRTRLVGTFEPGAGVASSVELTRCSLTPAESPD